MGGISGAEVPSSPVSVVGGIGASAKKFQTSFNGSEKSKGV